METQRVLHLDQAVLLFNIKACNGDASPHRHNLSNIVSRNLGLADTRVLLTPVRVQLLDLRNQLQFAITQLGSSLVLLGRNRLVLLPANRLQLLLGQPQFLRDRRVLDADTRSSLVDQVDRLVRQLPVWNVPVGKLGSGLQCIVRNFKSVVLLVHPLHAAQDVNRQNRVRGVNHHRLEATLQRRVPLHVFAIVVLRRRTNHL